MTGKSAIDHLIFLFNLCGILTGLGVVVYRDVIHSRPEVDDHKEYSKMEENLQKDGDTGTFELKKLIINLNSNNSRLRFIEIQLHLMPFKRKHLKHLEEHQNQIYDVVILTANRMTVEEINSVTGKILLESRIKTAVNKLLHATIVKNVYFTRFIIQ